MKIDRKEVLRLASLSSLTLSEEEIQLMQKDLENMLKFVSQIQEVKTNDAWSEEDIIDLEDLRDDEIEKSTPSEDILKNAPKKRKGYFNVPKVVD